MKLFVAEAILPESLTSILLLKLEDQKEIGISSLCSWTHLGDPSLEALKQDLLQGQRHSLTQKALFFAYKDLRSENIKSLIFPKTQKLLKDEDLLSNHLNLEKIKLKPKAKARELAKHLNSLCLSPKSLRIDFNNKLSESEFRGFIELCSSRTKLAIEYIEDPIFYCDKLWGKLRHDYPEIKLALDHSVKFEAINFDYYIWKPAKSFLDPKLKNIKIIPTHYLSNEVELMSSVWEASNYNSLLDEYCGFSTAHLTQTQNHFISDKELRVTKNWGIDPKKYKWNILTENINLVF